MLYLPRQAIRTSGWTSWLASGDYLNRAGGFHRAELKNYGVMLRDQTRWRVLLAILFSRKQATLSARCCYPIDYSFAGFGY